MPPPTNGELRERIRELEAALDDCETSEPSGQAARVRELEGLLAGCTRQLESCQRELAVALDALEAEPIAGELVTVEQPAHLTAVELAIERVARDLAGAGTEAELWNETGTSESRLEVLADAVRTLATAHQAIAPKPLPPITRQGHVIG